MSSGKLIAITGVTGSQGGAAARHLIRTGWRVRGLTRDATSARAQRAASNGVEVVKGDMSDAAALDRLFDGAYGAYVVTDFFRNGLQKEVQQGCAAADAAARAGVCISSSPRWRWGSGTLACRISRRRPRSNGTSRA